MAIAHLTALVSPPNSPTPIAASWPTVEEEIGTALPSDYKAFVEVYGLGRLSEFIVVFTPLDANPHANLIAQKEVQIRALRELRDVWGEASPYPLFPEPGGLLPFAATDNGDVLHWSTTGAPDQWTVVVNEGRSPEYELHECDMTTFLAEVLTGARRCSIFPENLSESVTFKRFD